MASPDDSHFEDLDEVVNIEITMVSKAHQLYQNSLYSESISGALTPLVNRAITTDE